MDVLTKAIETSGTIDEQHHLVLDEVLPIEGPKRVRVIILVEDDDMPEGKWLSAAARNPAYGFLESPGEDLYSMEDGRPFHG